MAVKHAIIILDDILQDQNLSPKLQNGLTQVAALLTAHTQATPLHSSESRLADVKNHNFDYSKRIKEGKLVNDLDTDSEDPPDADTAANLYKNAVLLRLKRNLQLGGWTTTTTAAGLPSLEVPPARPRSSSLISKSWQRGSKEHCRAFRNLVNSRKRSLVAYHNGLLRTEAVTGTNTPRSPLVGGQSNSCEHISCVSRESSCGCRTRAAPTGVSQLPSRAASALPSRQDSGEVQSVRCNSISISVPPRASLGDELQEPTLVYGEPRVRSASFLGHNRSVSPAKLIVPKEKGCPANCNSAHCRKVPRSPRRSPRSSTVNVPALPAAARALIDQYSFSTSDSSDSEIDQGSMFVVKDIHAHSLLSNKELKKWDFPIFQLDAELGNFTLSKLALKVFHDTGLLQCFKVPVSKFVAFFHATEVSYGSNSYHNYLHAADVLHACYYMTVQPVPGLRRRAESSTDQSSANEDSADSSSPSSRLGFCNFRLDEDMAKPSALCDKDSSNTRCHYGIIGSNLIALELLALYTAAVMHDYDHSGNTNAFLVETRHPLAILYNDRSVMENHHAAQSWQLLNSSKELNWLADLDATELKRFRFLFIELILATDLKRHFEFLTEVTTKCGVRGEDSDSGINWQSEVDRLLVMQMILKVGDLSGPTKSKDLHLAWVNRITEEFYRQGDEEARRGLSISPFMDRSNPHVPKLEVTFINHVVSPFVTVMCDARLLPGYWNYCSPQEKDCMHVDCVIQQNLNSNLSMWQELLHDEEQNATKSNQ